MTNNGTEPRPARRLSNNTMLLSIVVVILVCGVLHLAKSVVIPLIFAFLLSFLVSPVLRLLKKIKVPTSAGVLVVVALLLTGAFMFGGFLFQRVGAFSEQYPKYQAKFIEITDTISSRMKVEHLALGRDIDWSKTIGSKLVSFAGSTATFMANTLLILIFLVFILLEQDHFYAKLRTALPKQKAETIAKAIEDITNKIRKYLFIKTMVSLVTGVLVWLVLMLIQVDFAATWGILAFFLNFIPNLGSIAASIPPIFVVFVANYPSAVPVVLTAVCLLSIQITMGNIIEPRIQGQGLNLSPLVILFSLVFWGWLWGIPGMLLSVPITSLIKIVCENIEPLKPVGILIGESPKNKG